jgi:hypothetical protein
MHPCGTSSATRILLGSQPGRVDSPSSNTIDRQSHEMNTFHMLWSRPCHYESMNSCIFRPHSLSIPPQFLRDPGAETQSLVLSTEP